MDVLHGLRIFARVVEAGSFSAVAREMGITQPTVSKIISQLEAHFGAQLIARSTARLKLTEAGIAFHERSRKLLDSLTDLEASVGADRGQPSGRLRVSAPAAFGQAYLTPMLLSLLQSHPALEVDLVLNDRWFDLLEDGIDVALRFGPLPDSRLIARRVGVSPQVCLASPEYLSRHGEPRRLEELEHHRCVVNSLVSPTGRWTFAGPDGDASVHVGGNFRINNLEAIRRAVLAGNGIAVGPVWLYYDDIGEGRVRTLLPDYQPAPLDINALYVPSPYLPAKVGAFIAAVEVEIKRVPALTAEVPAAPGVPVASGES